ncbi:MAG: hypothetical protein QOF41_3459 [Methylobacteriaceae bacterium]|nr:hypothetical protein [Methylobacteriaceae bacterium]
MAFPRHRASAAIAAIFVLGAGAALADRIKHPTAVFAGLDKITGRIIAFEVSIDETVQFGSLQITPRACYTRPQTEAPQTDGFVEVDEIVIGSEMKRIFSGWMFAASPGLHGVEHPVYDVWITDCKGGTEVIPSPPDTTAELEPAPPPNAMDATKPPPPPKPGTVPRRRVEPPSGEAGLPAPGPQPLPGSPGAQPLPRGPIEVGPPPGGGGGFFGSPAPRQSAGPLPPADIPNVPPPQRRQPVQQFYPTGPVGLPDPAGPR